jgi:hypothetical protein
MQRYLLRILSTTDTSGAEVTSTRYADPYAKMMSECDGERELCLSDAAPTQDFRDVPEIVVVIGRGAVALAGLAVRRTSPHTETGADHGG